MTDNETLPTAIAARSAVDLMLCVIAALVLGMAVVWTVTAARSADLTNCEKASAYYKATQCARPFVLCDGEGNVRDPCAGRPFCSSAPMSSALADNMEQNSARLKADALAYQMLCNAEKAKP